MSAAIRIAAVVGLALGTVGCATLAPPQERQVNSVLSSKSIVLERVPMKLVLEDDPEWETQDRLSATVVKEMSCKDGFEDTVSTTTITSRETKNVGVELAAGLGIAAAGGVAVGAAPSLSNAKASDSDTSPRQNATTFGAIGIVLGTLMVGQAIVVAARGSDDSSEPVISKQPRAADTPPRACGKSIAGPGRVVAHLGDRTIALAKSESGRIVVTPRSAAKTLCADLNDLKGSVRLEYESLDDDELHVSLGSYRLKACVASTVAHQRVSDAASILNSAKEAEQISRALRLLAEADELSPLLAKNDADYAPLVAQIASARASAQARASAVFAPVLKETLEAINADVTKAVQRSADAIALAALTDSAAAAWSDIYQAFVRRAKPLGVPGYQLTEQLLDADASTRSCLTNAVCPSWLTPDAARGTLEPVAGAAASAIDHDSKQLTAATDAVEKKLNAKAVQAFDAAVASSRPLLPICKSLTLRSIENSCKGFVAADERATNTASAHESQFEQARRDELARERAERQKKATQQWRQHFAECRRLEDGKRALESIAVCDAPCRRVVSKMVEQATKLRTFSVEELVDDEQTLAKLRKECSDSGCEACP